MSALTGVVKYLTQQGYAILDHKRTQALLVFSLGHHGAQRLDDERHNLEIKVAGEALAFRFYTSDRDPHSHVPTQERNNLRGRAQRAVQAPSASDGKPRPTAKEKEKEKEKAKDKGKGKSKDKIKGTTKAKGKAETKLTPTEAKRAPRTFEVSVPTTLPAAQALAGAVAQLGTLGYDLQKQERTRAVLRFTIAIDSGSRFDRRPHDVEVTADGVALRLRFFTDHDDPNEIITKDEREALTERAQLAARPVAPTARPAKPPPASADDFRCRYCKQMTPLSLPQCRQCGADNFL